MLTLSYGFYKPQTGDKGSVFFPRLEDNFQKLNDHTHDGANSSKITAASSNVVTQAVASGSWALVSLGTYKQTVTLPAALAYDNIVIGFRDAATGHPLSLSVQKVSSTQYDVFINDNSLNLTAVYSS